MGNSNDSAGGLALAFLSGMASVGSMVVAFAGGLTCGAVVGLLLAPQSGQESRETLRRVARQVGGDVRNFSEKASDTLSDVMSKGRELLNEAETVVKDAVDVGRESMQQMRRPSTEESNPSQ